VNRSAQTPQHTAGGAEADCRRGAESLARGDFSAAARAFRKAIERGSKDPHAYNNLGVILAREADYDGAIPLFEAALARAPEMADAKENLVQAHNARSLQRRLVGRIEEAVEDLRASHALAPTAKTITDAGALLASLGRNRESAQCCIEALDLDPDCALAQLNLGAALLQLGRLDGAAQVLVRAIELAPDDARPFVNLASVEEKRGRLTRAEALAREAVRLDPKLWSGYHNVAQALLPQGDLVGTVEHLRAALAAGGGADSLSALLFTLNNEPRLSPEALFAEHRRFDELCDVKVEPRPPRPARGPGRRLRVGYLSPDLRTHSVAYFFEPLLRAHDRGAVEITCYSDSHISDAVTARLQPLAEHWRPTAGMPGPELAELIARDEIDVLVEMAGHTGGNRMALLARRVAPVQVTYLGYPASTGLSAMDLRITDGIADPVGMTEAFHSERLARVEGGFLCYGPGEAPPLSPPPCASSGTVTFGSFNSLIKVNDAVLDAWATLLHLVPNGRLLLKARAFSEEKVRLRLWRKLEARGIPQERVELVPPIDVIADHLAAYARIDIALDTFPYNGTTTTCEALWMGVPVVTFAGRSHASRVGASILARVGLDQLVAPTLEESLRIAATLAGDPALLSGLRMTMRDRMLASPLMDGARLARQVEAIYAAA
jgi:protein O-GlcNAc transferase